MSNPGVGFEYPRQSVSWLKRDVLLFANSIGCSNDQLHFLYELDPGFVTFPTYGIILPFKQTDQEVIDFYGRIRATPIPGVPKFDPKRLIDGQRLMQFNKPLPPTSAGGKFEVRSTVLGVYDKGKSGSVVETEQAVVNADTGEVYTRAVGQSFYRGQGEWGGPKGEKSPSYDPPKGKKPDATAEFQTTKETASLYRLNGDYNPLHIDPQPGKAMGFGGVIIHGLFSWNVAANHVLKACGNSDPSNLKEYQARFASPVYPGDKLITEMWKTGEVDKDGFEEIRFIMRVDGGKQVLSNGRALVKTGGKSKL